MSNCESIFGSTLPVADIETVFVESSSKPIKENNPHIDAIIAYDGNTPILESELVGESKFTDSLYCTLHVNVKDTIGNSPLETWFKGLDFAKYLKLCVLCSKDEHIIEATIEHPAFLASQDGAFEIPNVDDCQQAAIQLVSLLKGKFGPGTIEEAKKHIKENARVQTYSLGTNAETDSQSFITFDPIARKEIYSVPIVVGIDIPWKDPKYLAFVTVCTLDKTAIEKDFGASLSEDDIEIGVSTPSSVTVLQNGTANLFEMKFYTPDGEEYKGPRHKMPNGQWMTLKRHREYGPIDALGQPIVFEHSDKGTIIPVGHGIPVSEHLITKKASNTKIQDFRSIQKIIKEPFVFDIGEDLGFFGKSVLKETYDDPRTTDSAGYTFYKGAGAPKKLEERKSFFSDALYSNNQTHTSFFFNVNFGELLKRKSAIPEITKLILESDQPSIIKKYLSYMKIVSLEIRRKKVLIEAKNKNPLMLNNLSEESTLASPLSPVLGNVFLKDENILVVKYPSEDSTVPAASLYVPGTTNIKKLEMATFKNFDEIFGTIQEHTDWSTSDVLKTFKESIRLFQVTDNNLHPASHGLYQYEVELEVTDPSLSYLIERWTELKKLLKDLQKYYSQVVYLNAFDPHTGKFKEEMFTDTIVSEAKSLQVALKSALSHGGFIKYKNASEKGSLIQKLQNCLTLQTASLSSISTVVNIVENFVQRLQYKVNSHSVANKRHKIPLGSEFGVQFKSLPQGTSSKTEGLKTITIKHVFNSMLNKQPNEIGYKFITIENTAYDAPKLTRNQYAFRCQEEYTKYFVSWPPKSLTGMFLAPSLSFIAGDKVAPDSPELQNITIDTKEFYYAYLTPQTTVTHLETTDALDANIHSKKIKARRNKSVAHRGLAQILLAKYDYDPVNFKTSGMTGNDFSNSEKLDKQNLIHRGKLFQILSTKNCTIELPIEVQKQYDAIDEQYAEEDFKEAVQDGNIQPKELKQWTYTENLTSRATDVVFHHKSPVQLMQALFIENEFGATGKHALEKFDQKYLSQQDGNGMPELYRNQINKYFTHFGKLSIFGAAGKAMFQGRMQQLPNQIKSLLFTNTTETTPGANKVVGLQVLWDEEKAKHSEGRAKGQTALSDPDNLINYWLAYNNIMRVECSVYDTFLQEKSFVPLTKEIFDDKKHFPLLCRLMPHSMPGFTNEKFRDKLSLPVFNQHFLITWETLDKGL